MTLLGVDDVHEFRAHRAAVSRSEISPDLSQGRFGTPEVHRAHLKSGVEVSFTQLVKGQLQIGNRSPDGQPEGIQ